MSTPFEYLLRAPRNMPESRGAGALEPRREHRPEYIGELTTFEAPDPEYWVPYGYAILIADMPGTWNATGQATYLAPEEAQDFFDLIEWAGTQPWSSGKVGLSEVSYLTVSQWRSRS